MLREEFYTLVCKMNSKQPFVCFWRPVQVYAYTKEKRIDLLSGQEEFFPIGLFQEKLHADRYSSTKGLYHVYHLMFEYGYFLQDSLMPEMEAVDLETLLAIELRYSEKCDLKTLKGKNNPIRLKPLKTRNTDFFRYSKMFAHVRKELEDGNCYQVNLTVPHYFEIQDKLEAWDFIVSLWSKSANRAPFAHATYLPVWNKLLLSNSPESLFQLREASSGYRVYSMPIKGSLPFNRKTESFEEKWAELQGSRKEQAELFMIADLLRNDLCKLEAPRAKILAKRKALIVPQILHQYSLLAVDLELPPSVGQLVQALFPGGSVTGAPKNQVLKILRTLEEYNRGFYCGSTIVHFENFLEASLNIRSAEIDLEARLLKYASGGGVTLQSQARPEFAELQKKLTSFTHALFH